MSLPAQIVVALILGILVGFFCDQAGIPQFTTNYLKPFGTIFINLLKFIVVPVVLLSMIEGILSRPTASVPRWIRISGILPPGS